MGMILLEMAGWLLMSKTNFDKLLIKPDQLLQMIKEEEDFLLIDVREETEFQKGTIPGAVLIPLGELETTDKLVGTDLNTLIVVMCRSGARSARAQQYLFGIGFKNVYNLKGGILAWDSTCQ